VPWQPLLTGELAARAVDAIRAIAGDIPRHPLRQPGLAGGDAGLALFYWYLARAGEGGDDLAETYLEQAADAMAEVALPPALFGGYAGVAWTVEHLCSPPDQPLDETADPGADIDDALLALASRSPWTESYDLIKGLVGIGVHALERRRRPGAAALLDRIALRLAELAEPSGDGLVLWTPPEVLSAPARARHPDGHCDLGVAHGMPAAIALLASIDGDEARRVREGLTRSMAAARRRAADGSLFPSSIDRRDPRPDTRCRAAWCYGDPGIAAALLRGARAAADPSLEQLALEAGRAAAARTPVSAGVVDAGLCHGAAGLLHVFNRLYQATGDDAFRAAALGWAEDALARRAGGVGGYRSYQPTEPSPWFDDAGFLTGAAGIGLALLAAVSDVEPRWDVALLCDVPPR